MAHSSNSALPGKRPVGFFAESKMVEKAATKEETDPTETDRRTVEPTSPMNKRVKLVRTCGHQLGQLG